MNWKKVTQMVIAAIAGLIVVVLVYDAYAITQGGTEASLSSMIIIAAHHYPLIPLTIGIFLGHLFWRMKPNKDTIASIDKVEEKNSFIDNQNGHGYPSGKDWLKVFGIIITAPISLPVLYIRDKIKKSKEKK